MAKIDLDRTTQDRFIYSGPKSLLKEISKSKGPWDLADIKDFIKANLPQDLSASTISEMAKVLQTELKNSSKGPRSLDVNYHDPRKAWKTNKKLNHLNGMLQFYGGDLNKVIESEGLVRNKLPAKKFIYYQTTHDLLSDPEDDHREGYSGQFPRSYYSAIPLERLNDYIRNPDFDPNWSARSGDDRFGNHTGFAMDEWKLQQLKDKGFLSNNKDNYNDDIEAFEELVNPTKHLKDRAATESKIESLFDDFISGEITEADYRAQLSPLEQMLGSKDAEIAEMNRIKTDYDKLIKERKKYFKEIGNPKDNLLIEDLLDYDDITKFEPKLRDYIRKHHKSEPQMREEFKIELGNQALPLLGEKSRVWNTVNNPDPKLIGDRLLNFWDIEKNKQKKGPAARKTFYNRETDQSIIPMILKDLSKNKAIDLQQTANAAKNLKKEQAQDQKVKPGTKAHKSELQQTKRAEAALKDELEDDSELFDDDDNRPGIPSSEDYKTFFQKFGKKGGPVISDAWKRVKAAYMPSEPQDAK